MQRFPSRKLPKRAALLGLVVLAFALSGTSASAATIVSARDAMEPGLVERINDIRAANGLRRLRVAGDLSRAAAKHANSLGSKGYFKHELYTPSRKTTWTPYGTWIRWYWPGPGYTSWAAGENLAWGAPGLGVRKTVSLWMHSPGHRANLL